MRIENNTLYIVLDESGNLHKNSPNRYFLIGGYITNNSLKGRALFKKEILKYKKVKNLPLDSEIKGSTIPNPEKEKIISSIWKKYIQNNIFIPIFIIIDKKNLKKEIDKVNILYNFFIKILVLELNNRGIIKNKNLIIKLDNKTIKVGSINTLEEYLQGEFHFEDFSIEKVLYIDSEKQEEIQLADFICNNNWRKFEKYKIKKRKRKCKNIIISYFPHKTFGN